MPVQALTEEYVTVSEAAALLRVSPSTIRRWIRDGDLPAYRIGPRRVALRRTDLGRVITPAVREENGWGETVPERPFGRRLRPEEQRRGLEALERAERLGRQIVARRGGKPFGPSWEVLNALRDERMRQQSR